MQENVEGIVHNQQNLCSELDLEFTFDPYMHCSQLTKLIHEQPKRAYFSKLILLPNAHIIQPYHTVVANLYNASTQKNKTSLTKASCKCFLF